jgi:hypothetical protein
MARVKLGRRIEVENKNQKFGAAKKYIAIQVENEDGKGEKCLLFTEHQLKVAEERAKKNPEDLTKKGFITDLID